MQMCCTKLRCRNGHKAPSNISTLANPGNPWLGPRAGLPRLAKEIYVWFSALSSCSKRNKIWVIQNITKRTKLTRPVPDAWDASWSRNFTSWSMTKPQKRQGQYKMPANCKITCWKNELGAATTGKGSEGLPPCSICSSSVFVGAAVVARLRSFQVLFKLKHGFHFRIDLHTFPYNSCMKKWRNKTKCQEARFSMFVQLCFW